MRRLLTITLFLLATPLVAAEVLDNAAVIRLVSAGLGADVIVLKIEQSQVAFDTSIDGLVALKEARVPDAVIRAMLLKGAEPAPATAAAPAQRTTPPASSLASPRPTAAPPPTVAPVPSAPALSAIKPSDVPPAGEVCTTAKFYTLGGGGWGWEPAYVCVGASSLSVDEQEIPLRDVAVHCTLKSAVLSLGGSLLRGDEEWWFSDAQETFKFRGKTDDLERLAAALNNARRDVPRGGCGDRDVRKLLRHQ